MSVLFSRVGHVPRAFFARKADLVPSRVSVDALSDHEWLVHDTQSTSDVDLVGFIELLNGRYESLLLDGGTCAFFRDFDTAVDYFDIYLVATEEI
jgi:hypothetical protein